VNPPSATLPRAPAPAAVRSESAASYADGRPRVRVLYFMLRPDLQIYGGTRSLLTLLEAQRNVDAHVVVGAASPDDPAIAELARIGISHEYFPVGPLIAARRQRGVGARLRRLRMVARANRALARVIRRVDPQIVHTDYEGVSLIGPATLLSRRILVQHLRGAQVSGRLGAVMQGAMAIAACTVVVSDGLLDDCRRLMHPLLRGRALPRLVAINNGLRLYRVREALDRVDRDEARAALGIDPATVAVGLVGGIFTHKGQLPFLREVAPRVAEADPRVRFYLVGSEKEPAYAGACREAVRQTGLDERVSFVGWQDDVYLWYRAIDVLAFPSQVEGFGRAVAEAQAFGVPVVALRIPGISDTMRHGEGGFFAETYAEFVEPLLRLAGDPALRRDMGERGARYVRRFDLHEVARETEALYARLLEART
jgi:glycosyltransferase involved in cell wall biosynthesis